MLADLVLTTRSLALIVVLILLVAKLFQTLFGGVFSKLAKKLSKRREVDAVAEKAIKQIKESWSSEAEAIALKPVSTISKDGWKYSLVIKRLEKIAAQENLNKANGKFSGIVHDLSNQTVNICKEGSSRFLFSNLLFFELHASSLQRDDEVISMVARLFDLKNQVSGLTTTGTAETNYLIVLASREYFRDRGIIKPEIVLTNTSHPSIFRACDMMDIKPIVINVDADSGTIQPS